MITTESARPGFTVSDVPRWKRFVAGGLTGIVVWSVCQVLPLGDQVGAATSSSKPRNVVGLGDSLLVRKNSWFRQVCDGGYLGNCTNAGIRGDTTPGMVGRIGADVLSRRPNALVLMGGTNDLPLDTPADETVHRLDTMVQDARAAGITVVLCTVPPRDKFHDQVLVLNTAIRGYALRTDLPLLDMYAAVGTAEGMYGPGLSADGIHPNSRGSARMAQLAEEELPALLKS